MLITKIRRCVFETNSSSSHTITIVEGDIETYPKNQLLIDKEDNICRIYPGEFGWEIEDYYGAEMKASYALTYVKQIGDGGKEELLREVIEEKIGVKVKFIPSSYEYHPWGYIDHQSNEVCSDAFQSKETLHDFIFNSNSCLHIDNDNH